MSEDQESFVMKHVFDNFLMLESNEKTSFCGETKKHFGAPWRIRISRERSMFKVFLECLRFCGKKTWRINSEIKWKIPKKDGKLFEKTENYVLENDSLPGCCSLRFLYENAKEEYMIDGKFEIEVQVLIIGTIGIMSSWWLKIRSFTSIKLEEILNLAGMFESKTARTNCLKFLIKTSDRSLKMKFEIALKHKLNKLSSMCISDMSTVTELRSVFPEDPKMYEPELWAELYKRLLDLTR
ncbi:hypothetical protein L5515_015311 [Caenorhabditis briggsae]|uniref:MATH domain-containing protein n=1 Tax=Caenorhabditis briggsae TaxID=6238 RepID=A0AAE9EFU2_CAEBR|nr:hypothetical protein L5515_015311 [Caenorhabditis briggsae]